MSVLIPASSVLIITNSDSFLKEAIFRLRPFLPSAVSLTHRPFNEALNHPKETPPSLVLVDLTEPEEFIFSLVKRMASHFGGSKMVCAGHPSDVSMVLEFVKSGVKSFLRLPFDEKELKELALEITAPVIPRPAPEAKKRKPSRSTAPRAVPA